MLITCYAVPLVFFAIMGGIFTSIMPETTDTLIPSMTVFAVSMGALIGLPPSLAEIYRSDIKNAYQANGIPFPRKKAEFIFQEVFARLIMYNFAELIASSVILHNAVGKYSYKANFSVAVSVSRQFFLDNISPPDVDALIRRFVSLIRPGRNMPRKMTSNHMVSFIYRVA